MSDDERDSQREDIPFDEDPPVDPSSRRVGNSRARFVLPDDEADPEADEDGPAETGEAEPGGGAAG